MDKVFFNNHFPQLKLEAIQKNKLTQYLYGGAFLLQQKIFLNLFFAADKLLSPAHFTFEVLKIFKL
ncbi:hypothetical protein SOM12_22415 [Flavobacterium sp. CFBP9031]|uniref:hypothetical protein n=1 Tax=Flavobacterium sp. CFBP9031 TaxID=3096538 RepID=UPI002A6A447E|nr:hypothetical protein [Flavobacterium sp. CFBP9031]MDY0990200.1 hypothetical protein [Flavobacterium sp. CFBP9031]